MSGLLYKNFRANLSSFLFTVIISFICCAIGIVISILGGADMAGDTDSIREAAPVFAALYYCAFLLPSLTSNLLFEADENKTASAFAMSLPQCGKGHIQSKYWYILIQLLTVLFIAFVSDTVIFGILGGAFSAAILLVLIFCWRLLLAAVEIPFVIRFGSQKGIAIKGLVIAFVVVFALIYLMFGNISWLIGSDDPLGALIAWLKSGRIIFFISLFPFLSFGAYLLSCKISIKVFRKGAENYEQ